MKEKEKSLEEKIEKLRERKKKGYLNQVINEVTPIKSIVIQTPEEEWEEIKKSIFGD
jgi:hypothetical protein